ncbi:MAG: RNA polymerase sigma-28 factor [Firmicutes bacterium]|nr:RNA polymerase sigma-28 factor [Bacillota bacterium]
MTWVRVRLATYAARCIDNEILMHLRATKKLRTMQYLYEPTGVDKEGNELTLLDTLPNNEEPLADTVETALQQERLQCLLARLERREQVVLMLRFGLVDGVRLTQREIARELKLSRSYVSRIEKKAMQRLYSEVCKEGGF